MALLLEKPTKAARKSLKVDTSELAIPKLDPARDSAYRAFVRQHQCAIRGRGGHICRGPVEAAHIGISGLGLKSSDFSCIPLCQRAHRLSGEGTTSQHCGGWGAFMVRYDFNPWHVAWGLLVKWHLLVTR